MITFLWSLLITSFLEIWLLWVPSLFLCLETFSNGFSQRQRSLTLKLRGGGTFVSVCEFTNRRRLCSHYETAVLRPGSAATPGLLFHPLTSLSWNSNSTQSITVQVWRGENHSAFHMTTGDRQAWNAISWEGILLHSRHLCIKSLPWCMCSLIECFVDLIVTYFI